MAALNLDPHAVGSYLGKRLGASVFVDGVKRAFPGVSRQTWLIRTKISGAEQGFVLRADPPWGAAVPKSLRHEWNVYRALWKSEIPVAEPLWFEEGIDFLDGQPHMVRRLVEGSTTIAGLMDPDASGRKLRERVVQEHVEMLARLHRLDWRSLGLDAFITPPTTPAQAWQHEFDEWRTIWRENRIEPYPLLTEALCWLGENLPRDTPLISLVKGNNGVGEEIYTADGRIAALSDFELTTLGDGALDLAFSQGSLSLTSFGSAVRHYERCVGLPVSPERLAFSMFWILFKAIVCLNTCLLKGFVDGRDPRLTGAAFHLAATKRFERDLSRCIGRNLAEAWDEISGNQLKLYTEMGSAA